MAVGLSPKRSATGWSSASISLLRARSSRRTSWTRCRRPVGFVGAPVIESLSYQGTQIVHLLLDTLAASCSSYPEGSQRRGRWREHARSGRTNATGERRTGGAAATDGDGARAP